MAHKIKPRIAITLGDPAGIGPEIAIKALMNPALQRLCQPTIIGSGAVIERVAQHLQLSVPNAFVDPTPSFRADKVRPGQVQAANGVAAARWVEHAIEACLHGDFAAMVTCPLNKAALAAGGSQFPGHTELLAHRCGVQGEVMMLYDKKIAVVPVTIHQSLASVPTSLRTGKIVNAGVLFAAALRRIRGAEPHLAVLGLNPHAGEAGLFGDEEERIIIPAIKQLKKLGIQCSGPLPPDTAFTPANRARFTGYLCGYHDQALIPFKTVAFADGVNVTLGLPIIRTSVDHGTAYDIAWQGKADYRNLIAAVKLAVQLVPKH
jgi:4-phospho-D-threonate 3-dehydrogenase / 4-phospho-D-erythronate 3-dehydrogenase